MADTHNRFGQRREPQRHEEHRDGAVKSLRSSWLCGFLGTAVALICVLAMTVGCRSARRGEPIVGPLNSVDPEVQKGRLVFQENCYKCHPGGEGGLGPILNDKPFPRFLMKTQVRAGMGAMPSFHKIDIPPEELDALMKYIVAQRKHSGTSPQR